MRTIYLAGPMANCTPDEMHAWRDYVKLWLCDMYNFNDPTDNCFAENDRAAWHDGVLRDKLNIDTAELVLANVWKISHGTSMEIIYAHGRGKLVISVCPNGVDPWVQEHSHFVVTSAKEAINLLLTRPNIPKHQEYALGFFFDQRTLQVALIRKARPQWQEGKLNGIGGHCDRGENPLETMVREFKEETGLQTLAKDWRQYCTLQGKRKDGRGYRVHCFWTIGDISQLRTVTDEPIILVGHMTYARQDALNNIPWLIEMAIYDGDRQRYLEQLEKD